MSLDNKKIYIFTWNWILKKQRNYEDMWHYITYNIIVEQGFTNY